VLLHFLVNLEVTKTYDDIRKLNIEETGKESVNQVYLVHVEDAEHFAGMEFKPVTLNNVRGRKICRQNPRRGNGDIHVPLCEVFPMKIRFHHEEVSI